MSCTKTMLIDMLIYPEKKNWASLVKNLLSSLGFYEASLLQGVVDESLFPNQVKQRLRDTFVQNRQSDLNLSTRALFYRNIASFQLQGYLEAVTVKNKIASLCLI